MLRFTRSGVLSVLVLGGGGLYFEPAAQAQSTSREVLLGVSRIGSPAPSANDPVQIFDAATAQLRSGDQGGGQRQLEQLVARYPDSDSAAQARQILASLYAPVKPVGLQPASGQISHLGVPVTLPDAPALGAWRTSVRPAGGSAKLAQEGFRDAAGDLVFFSEGSDELGARARKTLAAQAEWLQRNPSLSVMVEGHADEAGTPGELKALSLSRANAVRARLIEQGVAAERIGVAAFGSERRVAICADLSCASQNRRAATVVGMNASAQLR